MNRVNNLTDFDILLWGILDEFVESVTANVVLVCDLCTIDDMHKSLSFKTDRWARAVTILYTQRNIRDQLGYFADFFNI